MITIEFSLAMVTELEKDLSSMLIKDLSSKVDLSEWTTTMSISTQELEYGLQ